MTQAVKEISQDLGKPGPFISTIPILGMYSLNKYAAALLEVFSLKRDENKAVIHEC